MISLTYLQAALIAWGVLTVGGMIGVFVMCVLGENKLKKIEDENRWLKSLLRQLGWKLPKWIEP